MGRPTKGPDGAPIHSFRDAKAFETWLEKNHARSTGVWLRLAKKAAKQRSVTYPQAVEAALCYGWIDGQARREDEQYSLQRFTPRSKRSGWSKRNRERVAALVDAGRMKPAGLAEIERAKSDGRWDAAYDSPRTMEVPRDLLAALRENPRAKAFFAALDSRNRYAILYQLQTAKRPATRTRRLDRFVTMLARGKKLYP